MNVEFRIVVSNGEVNMLAQPIRVARLKPGEHVISATYDAETHEVVVLIKRNDGATTEERVAVPDKGAEE